MWTLTVTLTSKVWKQSFLMTLWLMKMHQHTRFGYKRFGGSEDTIYINHLKFIIFAVTLTCHYLKRRSFLPFHFQFCVHVYMWKVHMKEKWNNTWILSLTTLCPFSVYVIIIIKSKIMSVETILSTYTHVRTHTHTHTHRSNPPPPPTHTHTHKHTDYTQLNLHNLKRAEEGEGYFMQRDWRQ